MTVRFRDLVAAERMKITTLPATWIALAVALAGHTLLGFAAGTDIVRVAGTAGPSPIGQTGTLMLAPAYALAAVAVLAAGGEHRAGQLRVTLAAVPCRDRLFAAKLATTAAFCLLASIPAALPGHLLRHAAAWPVGEWTGRFGASVAVQVLLGLVGFGFAVVASSVTVPMAVLVVLAVLGSPLLRSALPDVVRFLPHEAASSLAGMSPALGPVAGLAVLAGWAVVSVAVAWRVFVRRDG
ncbi:ABC transporter [Nonomuraea aridisoli]|uniref:ABC transporter n=1 Tax=Nonomuraea aridisoli TaxID=2070368 RepID=A0A2W2DTH2_9ACTN|nr:ABC transporter [Nonomuraea aridisoli]PZG03048.1 ABC transporter [Nonomuraea aridisoli]